MVPINAGFDVLINEGRIYNWCIRQVGQPFPWPGIRGGGKTERRPVDDASGSRFARGRGRGPGARDALADVGVVRRAQIVQHAVEGLSAPEIAVRLDVCKASVRFWL